MAYYSINIDGREIKALAGQTILQVALDAGIEIPNLCYDSSVETYGACGLCVVEIEGMNKLVRACATEIADKMVIYTNSPAVHSSRRMALDLLLSDHKGDCRPPCRQACPGETDCQGYVGLIANGYIDEALALIKESYPLPASIGRVCPHPCEDACRRSKVEEPIAIAWLKQFAADMDLNSANPFMPEISPATGKSVGIVGGGPAGLTMAYFLARAGHQVTIYDMMPELGGMLRYGIPEYRLPKAVLAAEVALIKEMGVDICTNTKIGVDVSFSYLRSAHDALYLAIGAWQSSGMRCEGEDLVGVIGGIDFLTDVALNKYVQIGKKVAVVGGGNTAMDACRTAVRLGAEEVYLLYRRTKNEMPAAAIEITEAEEEGVIFHYLVAPTRVLGENGVVTGIELQQMELGEPDSSGRRRPVPIEGAIKTIELDTIIAAIGQKVVPLNIDDTNVKLELTDWKTIIADEDSFQTSIPGVFAGGDGINNGPGIAIEAIGHAKKAWRIIDDYLNGVEAVYHQPYLVQNGEQPEPYYTAIPQEKRQPMEHMAPEARKNNFDEIVYGFSPTQAVKEANRCLECGCGDVFECKLLRYAQEYEVEPARLAGEYKSYPLVSDHGFIARDNNKCVLCGLCVRACEEVVGVGALGLHDRGFQTKVSADFGVALADSRCVGCGQCVALCPTGALQEKQPIFKSVPVETTAKASVCNFCGLGCKVNIHQHGNFTVKVTPDKSGQLCSSGRFGYPFAMSDYSMAYPLISYDGELTPTDWEEAYLRIMKETQSLQSVYGRESIGVVIGDKLTTEEIFLARHLAHDLLGTERIYSANATPGGLGDVLGLDSSTSSVEELDNTDLVLVIGTNVVSNYPILATRMLRQGKKGQEIILINDQPGNLNAVAKKQISLGQDLTVLKQIAKALIEAGAKPFANYYDDFVKDLADIVVTPEVREIAMAYYNAKHGMIVFDRARTSRAAAQLIAGIAVLSGKIGSPRNGIIQLRPRANTQGLVDMGVKHDLSALNKAVEAGLLKGLILVGHDLDPELAARLDLLIVADTVISQAMPQAKVVLPLGGFGSLEGSYTNFEGRVSKVSPAMPTPTGKQNWQVLSGLVALFPKGRNYDNIEQLREHIADWYAIYRQSYLNGKEYASLDGKSVRLHLGYPFKDGLARLMALETKNDYYRECLINDSALAAWLEVKAK